MTCDEIERGDIAEQYVAGALAEEARDRFEEHYFDCLRCLQRVERLELARDALANAGAATEEPARSRGWWRAAAALGAAAVVVLAVRVLQEPAAPSPTEPPSATARDLPLPPAAPPLDLERLGAIDPPPFTPPRLRSSASDVRRVFLTAMDVYNRGDYAGAVRGLEEAVRAEPADAAARFFLGVSYLQLDRRAEAIEHLQQVTRLGESPYLEEAHWFLAKAYIRGGDVEAAQRELRSVLALDGDRRDDASRLLRELP